MIQRQPFKFTQCATIIKGLSKINLLPIFLILFFLLWIAFFAYQKYLQYRVKAETTILAPNSIDSLEKITLGKIDQWIRIRGWDRSNPILLFLHGGPGAPLFTYARDIGGGAKLEQHFVMVYWEQRGTGKSFSLSIPEESMTIEQFVLDTIELAKLLKARFKVPKIFLVARSWGSLVGLIAVSRHPELFYSYVGIGQMLYPLKNDSLSYQYTIEIARNMDHKEALKELKKIGCPPYNYQDLLIQRKWLTSFYEKIMLIKFNTSQPNSRTRLLSTPEYSFIDILKMGMHPYFSIKHLWNDDFYRINLFEQIPQLEVPVYFFVGRYDYFTPSEIAESYYQKLIAPKGKHLIWFEKSGHKPEIEEPDKFNDVMLNQVLANACLNKSNR